MVKKIIVLGGGSAGFLAAITLKAKVAGVDVEVIRSKEIGIIGVGEGTTVSVPNFLHAYLGIDPMEFHRAVRPTFKMGIKFLWGSRPQFHYTFAPQFDLQYQALPRPCGYFCDDDAEYVNVAAALMAHDKAFVRLPDGSPGVRNDVAYHMENHEFVTFLESYAERLGVRIADDTVAEVSQDDNGVAGLRCKSGEVRAADLYIDCSGFYSVLLSKTLGEPFISFKSSLFCDRAVVGGWKRNADEVIKPYTTAETMDAGWCWRIDHENRVNRGYVYSGAFISDEDAEQEFRAKNPKITSTRVVPYVSGRYERSWVKNVVAIGNACGFVEPLESTSLAVICDEAFRLALALDETGRQPGPAMKAVYNKRVAFAWDDIRRFLALHYKFNTRLETPFWRACRETVDLHDAREIVDFYAENGPSTVWKEYLVGGNGLFGMEGYLALLVGQQVPFRNHYTPPPQQAKIWATIRQANREDALQGMTMREALDVIHSPDWRPKPGFFRWAPR